MDTPPVLICCFSCLNVTIILPPSQDEHQFLLCYLLSVLSQRKSRRRRADKLLAAARRWTNVGGGVGAHELSAAALPAHSSSWHYNSPTVPKLPSIRLPGPGDPTARVSRSLWSLSTLSCPASSLLRLLPLVMSYSVLYLLSPSSALLHIGWGNPSIPLCPPQDRLPHYTSYPCIGCLRVY